MNNHKLFFMFSIFNMILKQNIGYKRFQDNSIIISSFKNKEAPPHKRFQEKQKQNLPILQKNRLSIIFTDSLFQLIHINFLYEYFSENSLLSYPNRKPNFLLDFSKSFRSQVISCFSVFLDYIV